MSEKGNKIEKGIGIASAVIGVLGGAVKLSNELGITKRRPKDMKGSPACINEEKGYISLRKRGRTYYIIFKALGSNEYEQILMSTKSDLEADIEYKNAVEKYKY